MTDSIDKILERIHLQPSNLKNVTPQIIQKIFSNLSVGQISRLCQTRRSFNSVCRGESLWKDKLWNDYGVEIKNKRTWREEAKVVFLESEQFWKTINENINYFMTDAADQNSQVILSDIPNVDEAEEAISKFEKNFADHALREEKEFYATELIFRSFFNTDREIDSLEEIYHYVNFIPLFEKVAELSPRGKISLKWVLSLNHIQEVKLTKVDPDDLYVDLTTIEHDTEEYGMEWQVYNRDLFSSMGSLASIYMNHKDLFIDDTTADQKDIVLILNQWERLYF
uniref:F-box-like family protein n=1 Tax=Pithovirus LCPAC403 TaxID=2506596 RepID=A0A481ZDG1_9VIRU|nr:MAG: F-box-like family protein [Pithovirus LCPAC403]